MARQLRNVVGGYTYHVLNRANARVKIFENNKDYRLSENILEEVLMVMMIGYKRLLKN
jgi:REP element-mobilizing transposase RayT